MFNLLNFFNYSVDGYHQRSSETTVVVYAVTRVTYRVVYLSLKMPNK